MVDVVPHTCYKGLAPFETIQMFLDALLRVRRHHVAECRPYVSMRLWGVCKGVSPAPHKGTSSPCPHFYPCLAYFPASYDTYHPEGVQRGFAPLQVQDSDLRLLRVLSYSPNVTPVRARTRTATISALTVISSSAHTSQRKRALRSVTS